MSAGLLCAYGASRYDTSGISDRTLARARGFPLIGARNTAPAAMIRAVFRIARSRGPGVFPWSARGHAIRVIRTTIDW